MFAERWSIQGFITLFSLLLCTFEIVFWKGVRIISRVQARPVSHSGLKQNLISLHPPELGSLGFGGRWEWGEAWVSFEDTTSVPLFPSLDPGPFGAEDPGWDLSCVIGGCCQWWGSAFSLWPCLFLGAADGLCCWFPWGSVQRPCLLLRILQEEPAENFCQEYPQFPSLPLAARIPTLHPYSFTWIPEWATGSVMVGKEAQADLTAAPLCLADLAAPVSLCEKVQTHVWGHPCSQIQDIHVKLSKGLSPLLPLR